MSKPKNHPNSGIYKVQEEAVRRTKETGRLVRYAHIQKEETIQLIRERDRLEKLKLEKLKEQAKRSEEDG